MKVPECHGFIFSFFRSAALKVINNQKGVFVMSNRIVEDNEEYDVCYGEKVKLQDIFKEVAQYYNNWEDEKDVDIDAKYRNLRKKYTFLIENILFRDKASFKDSSNHNMVLSRDKTIIRILLIDAISPDKDDIIVKWFNGKVDTTNSSESIKLYESISQEIKIAFLLLEVDEVTMHEWLDTIAASINFNTAIHTHKIIKQIENFRQNSLALNQNINIGEISLNIDGKRFYHHAGANRFHKHFDLKNKTFEQLLREINCQDDYLNILMQVIHELEAHAKEKVIDIIRRFALIKRDIGLDKADKMVQNDSIASEYVIYYQRIYEFLKKNPDIVEKIEKEENVENLLDFFKMKRK